MPAGRGSRCEACYWSNTCRARIQMDLAAFATPVMREAFNEFGSWLEDKVGPHKAALTTHRHLSFFLQVEIQWKRIPTYGELLAHFAAEGLRRARLPMQWLHEAQGAEPDSCVRSNDSERRRIEVLVAVFPRNSWPSRLLIDYHNELMARHDAGRTSLRSVRMALRPAVSLLQAMDAQEYRLPNQTTLDRYLLNAPGQKAAITGFIRFLEVAHNLDLSIRTDVKKTQAARRCKLERVIIHMSQHPEEGNKFLWCWVMAGLEYFHWVKVNKRAVQNATIVSTNDGLRVTVNGQSYFLPHWDRCPSS